MGKLGFLGLRFPERFGGEMDIFGETLAEELVRSTYGGITDTILATRRWPPCT
jgi:hypothetical protein